MILEVESRLSLASLHLQRARIVSSLAMVFVYMLALVIVFGLVDLLIPLPMFVRFTILISLAMLFVWSIWFRVVVNCIRPITKQNMALLVEQRYPQLEDRLSALVQVSQNEPEDVIQSQIWDRLATNLGSTINNIDFTSVVDLQYRNRVIFAAVLLLMSIGLLVKHFPEQTETSGRRLLVPWQPTLPVLATRFSIVPGNARVLTGSSLPLSVHTSGRKAGPVVAISQNLDQTESQVKLSEPPSVEVLLHQTSQNQFTYEYLNLQSDFNYYLLINGRKSEMYTVRVFEPPVLTHIDVDYQYPAYTEFQPITQYNNGNLEGVDGTFTTIRLTTNKTIANANIRFNQDELIPIKILDTNTLQYRYRLRLDELGTKDPSEQTYEIRIECVDGFSNKEPITYQILVIPDKKPTITITEPNRDLRVTQLSEVVIKTNVGDDFGLQSVQCLYQKCGGEPVVLKPESSDEWNFNDQKRKKRQIQKYILHLEKLDLSSGDVITYSISALDTLNQSTYSNIYFIEIKSLNERYQNRIGHLTELTVDGSLLELVKEQKNVIRQTWKYISYNSPHNTSIQTITREQNRIQEKTEQILREIEPTMTALAVEPDAVLLIGKAREKMKMAIDQLANNRLKSALTSQQSALGKLVKSTTKLKKRKTHIKTEKKWDTANDFELEKISHLQDQIEVIQPTEDSPVQQKLHVLLHAVCKNQQQQKILTELYQDLVQQLTKSAFDQQQNITKRTSQYQLNLAQITQDLVGQVSIGSEFLSKKQIHQSFRLHLKSAAKLQSQAAREINRAQIRMALAFATKAGNKLEEVVQQLRKVQIQQIQKELEQVQVELCLLMEWQKWLQKWTASLGQSGSQKWQHDYHPNLHDSKKPVGLAQNQIYIQKKIKYIEYRLYNLQKNLQQSGHAESAQSVSKTIEQLFQGGIREMTSKIQIDLDRNKFDEAQKNQGRVVTSMVIAVEHLYQAEEKIIQTDDIRLENMIDKLTKWEDQLRDPFTANLSSQIIEPMKNLCRSSWLSKKSSRLLLEAINSLCQTSDSKLSINGDLIIKNIRYVKQILSLRLAKIKRIESLSQLLAGRVNSEYHHPVKQYYEEISR